MTTYSYLTHADPMTPESLMRAIEKYPVLMEAEVKVRRGHYWRAHTNMNGITPGGDTEALEITYTHPTDLSRRTTHLDPNDSRGADGLAAWLADTTTEWLEKARKKAEVAKERQIKAHATITDADLDRMTVSSGYLAMLAVERALHQMFVSPFVWLWGCLKFPFTRKRE